MDDSGRRDRRQDQGEEQDPAHRLLPQRRHHARRIRAAHQPHAAGPATNRCSPSPPAATASALSKAPDWGGGHGIFTYYVVKGMEGAADESRDGIVTADELAEYVRTQRARGHQGRSRTPPRTAAASTRNMLLAYMPSRRRARRAASAQGRHADLRSQHGRRGGVRRRQVRRGGQQGQAADAARAAAGRAHREGRARWVTSRTGRARRRSIPGQESTVTHQDPDRAAPQPGGLDEFDKGLEFYKEGFEENYRKAAEWFEKALALDPTYSQAALYLGLTYNAPVRAGEGGEGFPARPSRSIRITWRRAPISAACCSTSATWTRPSASSTTCCGATPNTPWR